MGKPHPHTNNFWARLISHDLSLARCEELIVGIGTGHAPAPYEAHYQITYD